MTKNSKFLASLILSVASWTAQAEIVAWVGNEGGGKIVLTDVKCDNKPGNIAYGTHKSSNTIFGCWTVDKVFVHIKWNDGDFRSYPVESWTFPKNGAGNT